MRKSRVVVILLLAVACVGIALWFWSKRSVSSGIVGVLKSAVTDTREAIERWTGEQLLAIANAHLNPHLSFSKLRFELPATVYLTDVSLTSGETKFVQASEMKIEFRETPKVGQPIVIQTVALTDPVVLFIEQPDGKLLGFSDLIKEGEGSRDADGGSTRLSDVFVIRRIAVANGTVRYEPQGEPAMYLDQMSFEMAGKPASESGAESAGWYEMDVTLARPPVLDWTTKARLNIDTKAFDVANSTLHMRLVPEQYEVLPPPLQAIVRAHEITGEYTATATGIVLFDDTAASDLRVEHKLVNGYIAFGEYQLPIKSLEVTSHMRSGVLSIEPIAAACLGGSMSMNGTIDLTRPHQLDFTFDAKELRIEQALRPVSDQPPKYSGNLDFNGSLSGQAAALKSTLASDASLGVRDARLINVAVIGGLVREAGGILNSHEANDRGSAKLQLNGERALFTQIDIVSGAIAGRGEGTIDYDSRVNFRINAGPLERLQGAMGRIGELFGKVTDKIVWYEVTGTLEEPVVKVKPLGL